MWIIPDILKVIRRSRWCTGKCGTRRGKLSKVKFSGLDPVFASHCWDNKYKLSVLTQFYYLTFLEVKSPTLVQREKVNVLQGCSSFWRLQEESISFPFPASRGYQHRLVQGHPPPRSRPAMADWAFLTCLSDPSMITSLSLTTVKEGSSVCKVSCDYTGPTWMIWSTLPIPKSVTLVTSAKFLLPPKVT